MNVINKGKILFSISRCCIRPNEIIVRNFPNIHRTFDRYYGARTIIKSNDNFLKKIIDKIGFISFAKPRFRASSVLLYESVADALDYQSFFNRFDLPNTFNSWFLVTELHVWMLMVRAMAEGSENGEKGRFIRNGIVDAMWLDVNQRAKQLGAQNPSAVRIQIQTLSQEFHAALMMYDEGIQSSDKILASALWRRFFVGDCENYEQLELLVNYVRQQIFHLDQLPYYDFVLTPNVKWLPLSYFNKI